MRELQTYNAGDGTVATVIWLNAEHQPVAPEQATSARITFSDGESAVFVVEHPVKAAARKRPAEGPLHAAADRHAPKLSVALRYAFALGRKALKPDPLKNIDRAVEAVADALRATLPAALRKTYVAGGEIAAGGLKTLGDVEGHPFHGNQWTRGESRPPDGAVEEALEQARDELSAANGVHVAQMSYSLEKIPIDAVKLRERKKAPEALVKAFKKDPNQVVPISVRPRFEGDTGKPVVLDGHRRIAAAKAAGLKTIWAIKVYSTTSLLDHESQYPFDAGLYAKHVFRTSAFRAAKRTTPTKVAFTFDAKQQSAVDWADRHAAELIDGISETTREQINNAIAEALEGEGIDQAIDEILDAVGDQERAETIAHHEVMMAVHAGQREAWDQAVEAGFLTGTEQRVWIVTGDEKVCPICEGLEDRRAKLGEKYEDADGEEYEGPPAHVRCRCTEGIV